MKTILDNRQFRLFYKKNCIDQRIETFYIKTIIANFFKFIRKPKVYLEGDLGDEVFDAIYMTLKESGISSKDHKLSPYDVVEMKPVYKETINSSGIKANEYIGMTVEFKEYN